MYGTVQLQLHTHIVPRACFSVEICSNNHSRLTNTTQVIPVHGSVSRVGHVLYIFYGWFSFTAPVKNVALDSNLHETS